ncbi:hypothetical protein N9L68_09165 [bacterium]|nr:hypothetical protein [bacterium]
MLLNHININETYKHIIIIFESIPSAGRAAAAHAAHCAPPPAPHLSAQRACRRGKTADKTALLLFMVAAQEVSTTTRSNS